MDFLFDPTVWIGLLTLITLEVVLGIDNLVFIAILADRLPRNQRDRARVFGLLMAMCLRLILLSAMSWLMTLTQPWVSFFGFNFSGRDFIFIIGGFFLLFKATSELHERLEANLPDPTLSPSYPKFWTVVLQIVVLDAVFSLDAIITAVGMVGHLPIMMAAVIIAMGLMLLASKALTNFVGKHPTIVMLCLGFLLMIGFSLVLEGFGFILPKGYLYAAIGFSMLIESFNQISRRNYLRMQETRPLRARTADAVLRLMGEHHRKQMDETDSDAPLSPHDAAIAGEESSMITGVLTLAVRSVRSVMTPRTEIVWINTLSDRKTIYEQLLEDTHNLYPICCGNLDDILGIARGKDVLIALKDAENLSNFTQMREPVVAPESMDSVRLLNLLRKAGGQMVLVADEFGSITGLVTPVDVFEIIAGEFLDGDDAPDIIEEADQSLTVSGGVDLHILEQRLGIEGLVSPDDDYASMAGFLLHKFGHFPAQEESFSFSGFIFTVLEISERRIEKVGIKKDNSNIEAV